MVDSGYPGGVKLGLGGHSYIAQLGNDPQATFEEQCALVAACLEAGIRLLDTTYYQERVALGRVLHQLGRRDEGTVIGWAFSSTLAKRTIWSPGRRMRRTISMSCFRSCRPTGSICL